jgi:hypothetical protein
VRPGTGSETGANLIVNRARPLFRQHDREWPAGLVRVAAARIRDKLGIETTGWLY